MNLTLSATKNEDGTHVISWTANSETRLHTVLLRVWFGKKKTKATPFYPFAKWVHTDHAEPTVLVQATEVITPELFSPSWTQANYEGYICQFNTPDSPADQYTCINSATASLTKK